VLLTIDGAEDPRQELEKRMTNDADLRAFFDQTLITLGAAHIEAGQMRVDVSDVVQ
jgi:hypothetical protein